MKTLVLKTAHRVIASIFLFSLIVVPTVVPKLAFAEHATDAAATESHLSTNIYSNPRIEDGQKAFNSGNYQLAFSLWQTLATQGHSDAQVFVGLSYANGWGVEKNAKLANHWYQKAANKGNASGQFLLGLHYISGVESNLATGVMWLRRAAENGDAGAQGFLKKADERGWFNETPPAQKKADPRVADIALADSIQQ